MSDTDTLAESTRRKVTRRILPFFFVLYVVAYLDRANVSFAKISMSADLHFSEAVYGFGAGVFFLGYFLLEIPGALLVERWSARLWISRILITWGICTVFEGFARTPVQFYAARFCLGLAEAGFFPGIIVYLTHWFARQDRSRALSGFILSVPISFVIGAPLSAWCLSLNWLGIAGWRWLFIVQGIPAIVCGVIAPFYMTDRPADARWLDDAERSWLESELEREKQEKRSNDRVSALAAFRNGSVWLLACALFLIVLASYGYIFWLPATIQKASGLSVIASTLLSALPFCAAAIVVYGIGPLADRSGKHKLFASIPLLVAAVFFCAAASPRQPFGLTVTWLTLTGALFWAWSPSFWVLPTLLLGESAAATSLGFINSIGNLGGFVGPAVVGYLLTDGRTYAFVIWLLSLALVLAAILILLARIPASGTSRPVRPPVQNTRSRHTGAARAAIQG
jgi:ACS family tartrate transporter-like MFS transporter